MNLMEHLDAIINIIAIIGAAFSSYLAIRVDLVRLHMKHAYHDETLKVIDRKVDKLDTRVSEHIDNHFNCKINGQ